MTLLPPSAEPAVPPALPTSPVPPTPPVGGWTLDALQALGAAQQDPLRFAYLQALASRAARQPVPVQRLLQARLALAMADCVQRCAAPSTVIDATAAADATNARRSDALGPAASRGASGAVVERAARALPRSPPSPSPLAALLQRLGGGLARGPATAASPAGAAVQAAPDGELKALQPFKRHWSRLSAERQVARSAAQLPANPGPLNSQLLALRALQQMQALSPAYLQHFVAQVEALLWLDSATPPAAPVPAKPARRDGLRKPKAGTSRA